MGYDLCILVSCARYDFGETYFYVPSFFHPIEILHRRKATKLFCFDLLHLFSFVPVKNNF